MLEIELCVRIRVENRLVSTRGEAIDQCAAIAEILRLSHGADPWIPTVPILEDFGSRVGRTIIDNDQFPLLAQTVEGLDRLRD